MKNLKKRRKFFYEKNSRIHFVGIIFILAVLCSMFIISWIIFRWVEDFSCLPFSKIVITGKCYFTTNNDIYQIITILKKNNKFIKKYIDVITIQIKNLPWIKSVNIRKKWPNELKIHLVEYVPIARWNDQYMIDINGNFFNVPDDRIGSKELSMIYAPKGSEKEIIQNFCKIKQILEKNGFLLKKTTITARRSWKLILMNGIKLNLGRNDPIKRLTRFVELYLFFLQQAKAIGKKIDYIDLRYDSGVAIGWTSKNTKESN